MNKTKKENNPELTNVALGAGITFAGILIGGTLQYLYHILLARCLGPDILGEFVLGITVVTIAASLSRLGLDFGILRYVPIYRGIKDTSRIKGTVLEALKLSGITGVIVSVLLFLFSTHISIGIFHNQELSQILKILSFTIPFSALMTLLLVTCQAFYIARYTALVQNFIYPLINIVLASAALFIGWKVLGIAAVYLISTLTAFALAGYFLMKLFPDLRKGPAGIANRKELLNFSAPMLGFTLLTYLVLSTDTLMLGFFRSSQDVGIYSAAVKTSMLLLFFLQSFNFIFAPLISDLYNKKDITRLGTMFKTITRWAITLAFPAFLFMSFWPREILHIFGDEFLIASKSLIILAFGQFINVSTGSVGSILIMAGKSRLVLMYALFAFVLNFVLNYILIPTYGIVGASVATAISLALVNILYLINVRILLGIHPYNIKIIKPLIGGIFALGLAMKIVHRTNLEWGGVLMLSFILLSAVYLLFLLLLGFDEDDKEIFRDVKGRIMNIFKPL